MRRRIVGIAKDELGEWVAELDCHHHQHVRHQPPFRLAPWVEVDRERSRRIGTTLDCPLCDRCELPEGLVVVRTSPTWDEHTMPAGLRRGHRIAAATWGRLHVEQGSLRFVAQTDPITDVLVTPRAPQAIPPDVEHHVAPQGPTRFAIGFLKELSG